MAKDWRCLIGLHGWREVEMPDRDKCAECTRCGKRDWCRLLTRTAGKWRGGDPRRGRRTPNLASRRDITGRYRQRVQRGRLDHLAQ
jgi:hypothetical protein